MIENLLAPQVMNIWVWFSRHLQSYLLIFVEFLCSTQIDFIVFNLSSPKSASLIVGNLVQITYLISCIYRIERDLVLTGENKLIMCGTTSCDKRCRPTMVGTTVVVTSAPRVKSHRCLKPLWKMHLYWKYASFLQNR